MTKRLGRSPIKYKTGDLLGSNNHIFIKDLDDKVYEINGIKRDHRWALFKCGLCGKEFENSIQKIKGSYSNYPKSCGCLQKKSVKKYFEEKRNDKN